jgi:predicted naringenin-chalcone synthase
MSFAILGMGTALPSTVVNQEDAYGIARTLCCRTPEQETWLPGMYANTGVRTRRLSLGADVVRDVRNGTRHSGSPYLPNGEMEDRGPTTGERMRHFARLAPPLAAAAASEALRRSEISASRITHLITVSCTGFAAPGVDLALINGLALPPTVQRTHVGFMGCHGAVNGLRVAAAFTGAEPAARVLLCAVELCSLHYFYGWEPSKVIANALFADGAAAVVGAPPDASPAGSWTVTATASRLLPDSTGAMTWTVGDHGFEMTLSKHVPRLIAGHVRPWLQEWLAACGLALSDVGSWALHPGGPRILEAVEDGLHLPRDAAAVSRAVFAEYGNMSSPTLLFILDRLRLAEAARPCVALAFGPGLMAEAALLK